MTGTFNFEPADGSVDGPYGDIVYLAEGPDGALYYVDLGYSDESGTYGVSKIRRIKYVQSNRAPIVNASADPTSGPTPLNVSFSSAGSSDPEGHALTYAWDVRRRRHLHRGEPHAHLLDRGCLPGAADRLGRRRTPPSRRRSRSAPAACPRPRSWRPPTVPTSVPVT